tara:strand:- start:346 stop:528 length:183 start_codon:yes stop_codon:yes gene_type:complete
MWITDLDNKKKEPVLLDYWMNTNVNETIVNEPNPQKKYNKISLTSKSKITYTKTDTTNKK